VTFLMVILKLVGAVAHEVTVASGRSVGNGGLAVDIAKRWAAASCVGESLSRRRA
jgi:hypothetical protein